MVAGRQLPRISRQALLVLLHLLWGCSGAEQVQDRQTSMIRGAREGSPSRRASENRPQPWTAEHGPFQQDRFDLEAHIMRRREQHQEAHRSTVLVMESFSHPACDGLAAEDRRTCPLLQVRWSSREEVPGGMVLKARWQRIAQGLRQRVLCHVAFGKVHGEGSSCPLHVARVRASVLRRNQQLILRLVTDDERAVDELRERIAQTIP